MSIFAVKASDATWVTTSWDALDRTMKLEGEQDGVAVAITLSEAAVCELHAHLEDGLKKWGCGPNYYERKQDWY